jgi:hypothetical protein
MNRSQGAFIALLLMVSVVAGGLANAGEVKRNVAKPVPLMQAIPLPEEQVSFQRDGVELARYYYGSELNRPFIYPVNGPSGRSLTRMGHPHDPETHSHHNSVWISHRDVNGLNFWEDRGKVRIVEKRILSFEDGPEETSLWTENAWVNETGKAVLKELRRVAARNLSKGEWILIIDLQMTATERVTFGKTPFGLIGVRMAKTVGVNDGGGTIRNSEGDIDEAGCFWKPAKWVDYSGPITPTVEEGVTLMDHPNNPGHPALFHVRNDGWMGACLTEKEARTLQPAKVMRLRYGLYVHAGILPTSKIEEMWNRFKVLDVTASPKAR